MDSLIIDTHTPIGAGMGWVSNMKKCNSECLGPFRPPRVPEKLIIQRMSMD